MSLVFPGQRGRPAERGKVTLRTSEARVLDGVRQASLGDWG
jgi:hypothetical protein